jgi:hypothetical protein
MFQVNIHTATDREEDEHKDTVTLTVTAVGL